MEVRLRCSDARAWSVRADVIRAVIFGCGRPAALVNSIIRRHFRQAREREDDDAGPGGLEEEMVGGGSSLQIPRMKIGSRKKERGKLGRPKGGNGRQRGNSSEGKECRSQ